MKYSIVYKKDNFTIKFKKELMEKIKGTYDDENPNVVFSIGGDGTVLDAVRKYIDKLDEISFVTINTGNIGFYTEFLPEDIDLIIELLNEKNEEISYPLIETKIDDKTHYSLNEVVFSVTHRLFEGRITIDDTHLMDLRSDGLCISTPSGSTAYNKSLKGAIVDPSIEIIQLVVMAPFETIDNRVVSPLVLSKDKKVIIEPKSKYFDVSFDRNFITYQNINKIIVKLSSKKAKFLKNKSQNFPKRLKEKFIGTY